MDAEKMEARKKNQYDRGVTIMLLLSALTLGEFMVGAIGGTIPNVNLGSVLMLVALLKAFFVVRDYMHVGRLFSNEEEH
jgi:hypothetical protein